MERGLFRSLLTYALATRQRKPITTIGASRENYHRRFARKLVLKGVVLNFETKIELKMD